MLKNVKILKKPLAFYEKHVIERIIGKASHANHSGGMSNAFFNLLGLTALLAVGLPLLSLTTFAGLSVYNGCGQ